MHHYTPRRSAVVVGAIVFVTAAQAGELYYNG